MVRDSLGGPLMIMGLLIPSITFMGYNSVPIIRITSTLKLSLKLVNLTANYNLDLETCAFVHCKDIWGEWAISISTTVASEDNTELSSADVFH